MSDEPTTTFKRETCPENDNCNLIVNYLPLSYRERHLLKLFSQIGDIKSCRVMRFVQDGRTLSKGYGFVKFGKIEEAQKAIETLNGKNVLGKQIKVSFARPNSQRTKSNLFISQIPKEWSDLELKHQFSSCGKIIESRVLRTEKKESRRCGFVRFDNNEQAHLAMEKMNGFRPSPFDVPIRVRIATQHEKNKAKLDEPEKDKNAYKKEDDTRSEITTGSTLTYQSEVSATSTSVSRRQLLQTVQELGARSVHQHSPPAPTASSEFRRNLLETPPMRSDPAAICRRDPARADQYFQHHMSNQPPQYHRRGEPNNMLSGNRHQHRPSSHHHHHAPAPRPSYGYDHPSRGYYTHMESSSYDYERRDHYDYMLYEREMRMLDTLEHERFARYDRGYPPMHSSSMYDHHHHLPHRTPSHAYPLDLPVDYPPPVHSLPPTNVSPPSSTHGLERVSLSPTDSIHTHPRHSGSTRSRSPPRLTAATSQTNDIHIVGLPKELVDSELRDRLKDFGDLEYVQIPKGKHGRGLGMAYASYVLAHSAEIAIKEMDGSYIADHRITVSLA